MFLYKSLLTCGKIDPTLYNNLYGLGYNAYGGIGDGTSAGKSSPVQIGTSSWTAISSGTYHTLGIKNDNTLWSWGYNNYGQLGTNNTTTVYSPVQIGTSSWTKISAGESHSLAVRSDGKLYGWGANDYGQIGSAIPETGLVSWKQLVSGDAHILGIKADGTLWASGYNGYGQLGDGTSAAKSSLVQIGTSSWSQIASTYDYTLGIKADGTLWAWGTNDFGQLGINNITTVYSPVQVSSSSWNYIAAGQYHSAAIRSDGTLWTWGRNDYGQLAEYSGLPAISWSQIVADEDGRSILAIKDDGTLWGWGLNSYGELGTGDTTARSSPIQIGTDTWKSVALNYYSTVGIKTDGTLWAWGYNNYGQLGTNNTTTVYSPVQVGTSSWTMVTKGPYNSYALQTNGSLWAWGYNGYGQLGQKDTVDRSSPVQVGIGLSWITGGSSQVICGTANEGGTVTLTIPSGYYVYSVDFASYGTPNGTCGSFTYSTCHDVNSQAYVESLCLNQTGTINIYAGGGGWLGDPCGGIYKRLYVQVTAKQAGFAVDKPSWTQISSGWHCFTGIDNNGKLWSFGSNNVGQLGDNTVINRSSPVQIGTETWNSVRQNWEAAWGYTITHGIKSDGSLWGWGTGMNNRLDNNAAAQTNDNTTTQPKSSPVQIGSGIRVNGNYSVAFDGSGDYLTVTGNLSTANNFTLEAFVYASTPNVGFNLVSIGNEASGRISLGISSSNELFYNVYGSGVQSLGGTFKYNEWNHVAFVRTSDTSMTGYINGIATGTTTTGSGTLGNSSNAYIWGSSTGASSVVGYVSNLRFVKGTAVYTSNFIAPSNSLTAIANTSLLTCQSSTIVDKSTNAYSITTNGDAYVSEKEPFKYASKYDLYAPGYSSTYFDGSGDYLLTSTSSVFAPLTGDFTIEAWVYSTNVSGGYTTIVQYADYASGFMVRLSGNALQTYVLGSSIGSATINANTWYHIAVSRQSGTVRVFVNGSSVGTGTVSGSINPTTSQVYIGDDGAGRYWPGYISNVRYVVGTAVYTSNFTPSTTPLTAIANTSLLTCQSADTIKDNSTNAFAITTFGNARTTTTEPFGYLADPSRIGSAYFDGTGDYLTINSNAVQLGTGDFTIEFWAFANTGQAQYAGFVGKRTTNFDQNSWRIAYGSTGANTIDMYYAGNLGATVAPFNLNTWNHVAFVRSGTTLRAFVNGVLGATTTGWSYDLSNAFNLEIGTNHSGTWSLNGYISNLRIVKGTALYTKNFEVPKTALYPIGDTVLLTCQGSRLGTSVVDRSSYVRTITQNGDAKSSTLSPFNKIAKVIPCNLYSVAFMADGSLWSWGYRGVNLGYSNLTSNYSFRKLYDGGVYEDISHQQNQWQWSWQGTTFLKKTDHTVIPMGINEAGQLGQGFAWPGQDWTQLDTTATIPSYYLQQSPATVYRSSPVQVPGSWSQVKCAYLQTLALKTDGTLWSWGYNDYGQLGNGTFNHRSSPVQVGTSSWSQISTISGSVMGIKSDNTLWAWGNNSYGGINNYQFLGAAIYTGDARSYTLINSGYSGNNFGIDTNGTLWTLGRNDVGQLGIGNTSNRSSPVQISSVGTNSWSIVEGGPVHTVGIQSDGTLWAWGGQNYGQGVIDPSIGYGYRVKQQSWSKVSAGYQHVLAIKPDGSLWGWGRNQYGQLGLDSTVNLISSPVQIGSDSWTQVVTNNSWNTTFGIKSDGSLWSWGQNYYGILGANSGNSTVTILAPRKLNNSSWLQVSLGETNVMALRTDGSLWAWGQNDYGQLGDGTVTYRSSPVQIGTSSWSQICAGNQVSAAIRSDGKLFTWGYGLYDGLGRNYSFGGQTYSWTKISTGRYHTLAIRSDGALWSWGYNNAGQLGDNTTITKSSPVQIGTSSWSQVYAAEYHSLAIASDGKMFVWGHNGNGQIGDGTTDHKSSPVQIGTSSWSIVSGGEYNSVGITTVGTLWTWGVNRDGQCGIDSIAINSYILTPQQVAGSWTKVSSGRSHMMAIKSNNTLWTWGYNGYGELGQNDTVNRSSPVQVGTSSWSQVSAGYWLSTAIKSNGTIYCWGVGTSGELGQNDTVNRSSPVQVGSANTWSQVNANWGAVTAMQSDGSVWVWGTNNNSVIPFTTYVPYKVSALYPGSYTQLGSGSGYTSAIIRNDNIVFICGSNDQGQIGSGIYGGNYDYHSLPYNLNTSSSSPVQVGNSSWTNVYCGSYNMMATKSDGTLWAWGRNDYGQLGDNTRINKSSPVQIATSGVWASVYPGSTTYAIKPDGTLWGWGYNDSNGYYGISDPINGQNCVHRSSPVQVLSGNTWSSFARGGNFHLFLTSLGEMFARGDNSYNQYGNSLSGYWNNSTYYPSRRAPAASVYSELQRSIPVQIDTGSWSSISVGDSHTLAIKSNGTLWAWGFNDSGQLGLSDTSNRSSPTQIGTSSWTKISAGERFSVGIRADGKLFTWGNNKNFRLGFNNYSGDAYSWTQITTGAGIRSDGKLFVWGPNDYGAVGDNTTVTRSSPVQIGTSSWTMVNKYNRYNTYAIRADGTLWGWGLNDSGQLADGTIINKSSPVQMGTANTWSKICAGSSNLAAIKTDGSLWVCGYNGYGQFGSVASQFRTDFDSRSWSQINVGQDNCVALATDGSVWCWGRGDSGQIGNGSYSYTDTPTHISSNQSFTQVITRRAHVLALDTAGLLWGWGSGTYGVLSGLSTRNTPGPLTFARSFTQISAGGLWDNYGTTLAISTDSTLWVCGYNDYGQLGLGDNSYRNSLTQVPGSWTSISGGGSHTLGIKSDGTLWAWGYNGYGQLGTGNNTTVYSPVQIGTSSWTKIAAGEQHSVAIRVDGTLWAWGLNNWGQLGTNNTTSQNSPVQIGSATNWTEIGGNYYTSGAIRSDGSMWTWGYNYHGQCGAGTNVYTGIQGHSSPVQVGTDKTWSKIQLSTYHSSAIDTTGTLYLWGYQRFGSCAYGPAGNGDYWYSSFVSRAGYQAGTGNISTLTQIGTSSWSQVASGAGVFFGITSDKKLFASGLNNYGQLGLGDTTNRNVLTQVGNSSWSLISTSKGYYHALGIKADNTLWAWGYNDQGQLGQGNTTSYNSPVQIGTDNNWSKISANYYGSTALKTDGTLWGWGRMTYCFLGADGYNWVSYSPIQIGSQYGVGVITSTQNAPKYTDLASDYNYISVIKSDGKLYNWGYADASWFADGTPFNNNSAKQPTVIGYNSYENPVSSPTQIGTDSWIAVSASASHVAAVKSDGTLWGWGSNVNGELGDTTFTNRSSPVQMSTANNFSNVYCGLYRTIAIDTSGLVWSTGYNNYGTLMDNYGNLGSVRRYLINGANTISSNWNTSKITTSKNYYNSGVIKNDGTAWFVGYNDQGQMGQGDNASYNIHYSTLTQIGNTYSYHTMSSPTQIGSDSWSQIGLHVYSAIGIKSNGTLWYWGNAGNPSANPFDNGVYLSSPTQVGTSNNWISVTAGYYNQGAINSSNVASVWGWSYYGAFGNGTAPNGTYPFAYTYGNYITTYYSSPVQIDSGSWTSVSAGTYESSAIKSDGSLWTWGRNNNYQLGQGHSNSLSSPTQIGTSSWTQASIRYYSSTGITNDGKLMIWGSNQSYGQGGLSDVTTAYSWTQISHGSSHLAAIRSDGKLFVWGSGSSGQLGNSKIDGMVLSPVQVGTSSWTKVSCGRLHINAIRVDGTLWGWGYNGYGSVGDNTTINRSSPVQIGSSTNWTNISCGGNNSAGINNNKLFTWGENTDGVVGDNTIIHKSSPTQIGNSNWSQVSIGDSYVLALSSANSMFAWGSSSYGRLGIINNTGTKSSWTKISCGTNHMLGIKSDGTLWGWGYNGSDYPIAQPYGINYRNSPVQIMSGSWSQVAAGYNFSGAIRSDGTLWMWGRNDYGQCATYIGPTTLSSPVQIGGSTNWSKLSLGYSHAMALQSDGSLWTWGYNGYGQLGISNTQTEYEPVQVGTSSWTAISAGPNICSAIRSDSKLFVWGYNGYGQIGDATTSNKSSPVQVGTSNWSDISIGYTHTSAVRSDGALFTWGGNGNGELGQNDTVHRSSPVQVGSSTNWSEVSNFGFTTIAKNTSNQLFAWGYNGYYMVGDGTSVNKSSPVQIGSGLTWSSLADGTTTYTYGSAAILNDGTAYVWGNNAYGQLGVGGSAVTDYKSTPTILGNNDYIENKSSPCQIGTSSWSQISAGIYEAAAIRTDGALFVWGYNYYGGLAQNDTVTRSSPVQIGTNSWTKISSGYYNMRAIRSDGTLWTWGYSNYGLGNSSNQNTSSPVQIGTSSWTTISSNWANNCAGGIKVDGTLWVWGAATDGSSGHGYFGSASSPVQIGNNRVLYNSIYPTQMGSQSWIWAASEYEGYHNAAIRSDYTLWTWGGNGYGQLGQGDTIDRSSPVQIGSGSWRQVVCGWRNTYAIDKKTNKLSGFGYNGYGQLDNNSTTATSIPWKIGGKKANTASSLCYTLMIIN